MNGARVVYVNGDYLPDADARISVFDRGFLMADSVYEVTAVLDGKLLQYGAHAKRLRRSLDSLSIPVPGEMDDLEGIHRKLLKLNRLKEGIIYLQISRGAAERDFNFPNDPHPSVVAFTQAKRLLDCTAARSGIRVVTLPDLRWGRCDIKTTQLLAACLAKAEARKAGADDAWLVRDGRITEGTSSNAFIVTHRGILVTRSLSNEILHGITRATVLKFAAEAGLKTEERAFTPEEAIGAAEAFITSASTFVWPVVNIDGHDLGDGKPGPLARRLRRIYLAESVAAAC